MRKLLLGTVVLVLLGGCGTVNNVEEAQKQEIDALKERIAVLEGHSVYVEYELVDIAVDERGLTEYILIASEGAVIYDDDMPEGAEIGDRYRLEIDPSGQDVVDGIVAVEKVGEGE